MTTIWMFGIHSVKILTKSIQNIGGVAFKRNGHTYGWMDVQTDREEYTNIRCLWQRIKMLTYYQTKSWNSSKLKVFADDNFKFQENEKKLSKQEENTVGKGEIARYKQFLLFPQCFQKACFPGVSKGVIVWEWVKVPLTSFSIHIFWFWI